MLFKKYTGLGLCLAGLLTGCWDKLSADYLLRHPEALFQAVAACQSGKISVPENPKHCQQVREAAATISPLVEELQLTPEKFGQRILAAEIRSSQLKHLCQLAQERVAVLEQQGVMPDVLRDANSKWLVARHAYQQQKANVDILLAVAALNSPE